MAKDEAPSIASVLKKVQKDYDLRVGSLSDVAKPVDVISSGNLAIDDIVGVSGLPLGRSIEMSGNPSSGKTTCALQTAANLQKSIIASGKEEYILYSDYENSLDVDYANTLGLDLNHPSFLLCQPDTLEQGTNVALELIRTGKIRLGVWDSVAAMTPEDILTSEVGKVTIALQARLLNSFLQKLNPLIAETNCCALFINHIKEVIPVGGFKAPGPPQTTTPGGKALKYYASVRLEFQQVKNTVSVVEDPLTNAEVKRVESTTVRVRVTKNKVGAPFREALVRVRFGKGFDNFWTAMQILVGRKLVPLATGFYYFDKIPALVIDDMDTSSTGRPYVRGEEVLLTFADNHPEWREKVIDYARTLVGQKPENVLEPVVVEPKLEVVTKPKVPVPAKTSNGDGSSVLGLAELVGEDDQLFKVSSERDA